MLNKVLPRALTIHRALPALTRSFAWRHRNRGSEQGLTPFAGNAPFPSLLAPFNNFPLADWAPRGLDTMFTDVKVNLVNDGAHTRDFSRFCH